MKQITKKELENEIKLPRIKNIQSTFIPPNYPLKTINWLIEYNSPRKPNYEK